MANYRAIKHKISDEGGFRCEKCQRPRPLSMLRNMDGANVCSVTCYRPLTLTEFQANMAEAARMVADIEDEPVEHLVESPFEGGILLTDISAVATPTQVIVTIRGTNLDGSIHDFGWSRGREGTGTLTFFASGVIYSGGDPVGLNITYSRTAAKGWWHFYYEGMQFQNFIYLT